MSLVLRNRNLFDDFFSQNLNHFYSSKISDDFSPLVNLRNTEKAYVLEAELAGVSRDDIDIATHEGYLILKGHKKFVNNEEGDHYHHVERTFGEFERRFRLGKDADVENITANYDNGLLVINVPRVNDPKRNYNKVSIS